MTRPNGGMPRGAELGERRKCPTCPLIGRWLHEHCSVCRAATRVRGVAREVTYERARAAGAGVTRAEWGASRKAWRAWMATQIKNGGE